MTYCVKDKRGHIKMNGTTSLPPKSATMDDLEMGIDISISDYDEFCNEVEKGSTCFEHLLEDGEIFDDDDDTTTAPSIQFACSSPEARVPSLATEQSTGYDLYSTEECILYPGQIKKINTGIRLLMPKDMYGEIKPRSGMGILGISVASGGIIDNDYRGDVFVPLLNQLQTPFKVYKGSRIGQLILKKFVHLDFKQMDLKEYEKHMTSRGKGGFGSTGLF